MLWYVFALLLLDVVGWRDELGMDEDVENWQQLLLHPCLYMLMIASET